MKLDKRILLAAAVILIVAVVGVVVVNRLRPHSFNGIVLQAGKPAADFTMTASTGKPASLSDYRGKWVILYFGYTFCPDVCPTTLAKISAALNQLGDKAKDVQVVMVSVDPERDTPERLATYLGAFNPTFLGLTGTVDQVSQAATPFGIYFAKNEVEGASGYLVDHTASVTLVDPEGRTRLVWLPDTTPEAIAGDLNYLLR